MRAQFKALREAMVMAGSYREWREAAQEHDRLTGMAAWREEDYSPDYDWQLIKTRLTELRRLRHGDDVLKLAYFLHEGLHGNLGGMGNPALYQYARFGTKRLVEDYIHEVAEAVEYLHAVDDPAFPTGEKIRFFSRIGKLFGRTGLLLSGGATLGMFHLGVVKALVDEGLMPRVLSGSSAGSIIVSVVGTHTDAQLSKVFEPEYLSMQAWRMLGIRNALRKRAIMDPQQLSDCIRDNVGDYSFEEAFELTGRIINIPVSPANPHEHARLLNYLAGPNVMVRQTSLASCAVPALFPPVELLAKDYAGDIQPYLPGRRWVDGSIEGDLPMLRMARLHNVNFYIVSQTNPHVVPFLSDQRKDTGLLPFVRDLATTSTRNTLKVARDHMRHSVVSNLLGKVHSITDQNYRGDVTIFPSQPPSRLLKVISNPTPQDIDEFIREGLHATWPKLERIRLASHISRSIDACLLDLKSRNYGVPVSRVRQASGRVVDMAQRALRMQ